MLRRFLPIAVILSLVLRLIFFATETYLHVPEALTFIFAQRRILSIIIALIIAGIDSLVYSAGQRLTENAQKYPYILDGAFIRRNQEKERKLVLKATAEYDEESYYSAVVKLNKLLKKCERNRDYYAVHCLLGAVRSEEGKNEEALEHWKKAVEYENAKAYGYSGLANTYLKLKKYNEAIENGKKAINIDKKMYQAYETLCIAYKATGDEEKFLIFHEAVIALKRNTKKFNEELAAVSG